MSGRGERLDVESLFRAHGDDIFAYAARRVGRESALEITADTFRIALESADSYDVGRGAPRPWLFGITSNLIRQHWRAERRQLELLRRDAGRRSVSADAVARVDEQLDAAARLDAVLGLLAELSPEDRDVVTLFAWEGLTYDEIADALGIPVGTVRSRLHRSRRSIRPTERTDP